MTASDGPLFDTHAHVVSDDVVAYPPAEAYRTALSVPFTVEQLVAGMDANNVATACVVQRYHYYYNDNSYVLDSCRSDPGRLLPIVILDGRYANTPDHLRGLAGEQRIGGIRLAGPALNSYDTAWLNSPGVMRLWECAAELGLPVAVIMFEPHMSFNLPALKVIAETFPELPIIVDHLGSLLGASPIGAALRAQPNHPPYISEPDFGVTPALRELIDCPNVNYKFTGIVLEKLGDDGVDPATFLRFFLDLFGADRIVFGTDIGQTKGPYERITGELRDATALLTEAERAQVLHDNAGRIYAGRPA